MERFFDIVFSGLALLALSPLLVPIVIILKCSGEGEVFFLQERIGKEGAVFKLFKLAGTGMEDKKSCSGYPGSIHFPTSSSFRNMFMGERCKTEPLGGGSDSLFTR